MRYFVVDAFADELFKGNPAGVCLTEGELDVDTMLCIAAENNLSETAFVTKKDGHYGLRWFTPVTEIDLCGHATLGSAYVIANFVDTSASEMRFETKSGILTVTKDGDVYVMDFPSRKPVSTGVAPLMEQAVGTSVVEAFVARDLMLLLESERQVRDLSVDIGLIRQLASHAVIVTAKGDTVDFVSRFFAPNVGVPEDPVTGSAHTTLIPFWAEKLGMKKMTAKQLSSRGGTVYCEDCGDRVKIAGKAALYLKGEIFV